MINAVQVKFGIFYISHVKKVIRPIGFSYSFLTRAKYNQLASRVQPRSQSEHSDQMTSETSEKTEPANPLKQVT